MIHVIERLKENIFATPYASEGKIDGLFQPARKVPKSVALTKPLIQINGPRRKKYLTFDIDRPLAGLAWEDANVPIPNIVITNPDNGHAHLIYELQEPIWERRGDDNRRGEAKPVHYYNAVWKAMGKALRADSAYNGLLVKNPLHSSWVVSCGSHRPYNLGELSRNLELKTSYKTANLKDNHEGRNCTLFDSIRLWAYRNKNEFSDLSDFRVAIDNELDKLNQSFTCPLAYSEVNGIAKSVTKWVWYHYQQKRRGIMGLDSQLPLQIKQQLGQKFTSRLRYSKTLSKIQKAYLWVQENCSRITKSAVSLRAKVHRNTVSAYWSIVSSVKNPNFNKIFSQTQENLVRLRHESLLSVTTTLQQRDTLNITHLDTASILDFDEAKRLLGSHLRACCYAVQKARDGVLIENVPTILRLGLLKHLDKWRSNIQTGENDSTNNYHQ